MEHELTEHLNDECGALYLTECCAELAQDFESLGVSGITATCGGFYGPQGRQLRIPLRHPQFIDKLAQFKSRNYPVVNLEMETAALYAMSSLLGHRCISLSVILANRTKGTFASDIKKCQETLITRSLSLIKDNLAVTSD